MVKLLLVEDQEVIKTFSSYASQKAFTDGIRSWCVIGRFEELDVARCCNPSEAWSIFAIVIANKIPWCLPIRSGFSQLLRDPAVSRRLRNAYVDDFPRLQLYDKEGEERVKEKIGDL
jgi:hypothetical protein